MVSVQSKLIHTKRKSVYIWSKFNYKDSLICSINILTSLELVYLLIQVCIRGSCEEVDATFIPVDGGWSSFDPYGDCSRMCETGVRFRERLCKNPT